MGERWGVRCCLFVFRVWETISKCILIYQHSFLYSIIVPNKQSIVQAGAPPTAIPMGQQVPLFAWWVFMIDIIYLRIILLTYHITFFVVWRLHRRMKMVSRAYLYSLNWKMPTRWVANVCIGIVSLLDYLMLLLISLSMFHP